MKGDSEINNSQDTIDSRDIIERIKYLEDDEELDEGDKAELEALKALAEEAEEYAGDWEYGEQLIRESYFKDYCQELCEDTGDIPKDLPWYMIIDWEATADNIKVDYTEVDFGGVTYLVR